MVDIAKPRREQLAALAAGDNRLLIALEQLFDVVSGGATGSFTTADAKTVTVVDGVITDIT